MSQTQDPNALKVIPLGGLHEIGKNTCVFEINDEIMLLDAGLAFPTEDMHGVNIVLPDTTYLRENRHKIKGMIVTHGHEDHIGGIAFHLKQFDIPVIYGPRLAMALLEGKLEEAGVANLTELRTVMPRDMVRIGNSFFVEFIRNTHSIADSFSVAIHTPVGIVIHTGDFKIDHTPVDGEFFDFQKLAEYGEKGVLCLISDSTNAEVPGSTPSERSVYPNLERIFSQAKGRLLVTTFASSVHRVNMILNIAEKQGRSVFVLGRSMLNVIDHARRLGYIKCSDELFQPLNSLRQCPDEKALILTTGSQGEPLAALTRIANSSHRQIQIKQGDTVVFSANPIPGNTIAVVNTIDKLMMKGANVVYGKNLGIHVSGHGAQEDQKLMLALTRPKLFLPVHGEHRMLVRHAKTAQSMGVPAENMVIVNNGDVVELTEETIRIAGQVPSGIELVDSSRTGMVADDVLRQRQRIAEDGIVTVAATVNASGKLAAKPSIHLHGVALTMERSQFEQDLTELVESALSNRWTDFAQDFNDGEGLEINWEGLRNQIETELYRFIKRELRSRPSVVLLMQTVEAAEATEAAETNGKAKSTASTRKKSIPRASAPSPAAPSTAEPEVQKRTRRRSAAVAS